MRELELPKNWRGDQLFKSFEYVTFKASEYPFKQNKNMWKNMTVLLYSYFNNISLNVLRPTFFNIYSLPFLRSRNIGELLQQNCSFQ